MRRATGSHLAASVVGGLIVAGGVLAFGMTGRRTMQTIVQEAPGTVVRMTGQSSRLTPHAIYQRESPGVLYISARLVAPEETPFDVLHQAQTGMATGSGFLVDQRGDVMTNYHLIAGASPSNGITVRFEGGVQRVARVVAEDRSADVAVLRVPMRGVPAVQALPLGDSTSVRVGDPILVISNPYGLDRTLSTGIVSGLAHQLVADDGASVDNVIQVEQPFDPAAASGGPLLDATGRVIGVNSAIAGPDEQPIPFATPIDAVEPLLNLLGQGDQLAAAYLGLSGVASRGTHPAVSIARVARGGPAARAGLRRGDAIYRVGGVTISTLGGLAQVVSSRAPGQRLSVEILRAGRIHTLTVRLGVRQ